MIEHKVDIINLNLVNKNLTEYNTWTLEKIKQIFEMAYADNNVQKLRDGANILHLSKGQHIIYLDDTITDCSHLYGGDPREVDKLYCDSELPRGEITIVGGKNVTNCSSMFQSLCKYIRTIDLRLFNMSNVQNMRNMFDSCENLERLKFGEYLIDKVTDLSYTFSGCKRITYIDLSNIFTDNVLGFRETFSYCENLRRLNTGHFKFNAAEDISGMCSGCSSLKSIDLSSLVLNIDETDMNDPDFMNEVLYPMVDGIFADCGSLKEIKTKDKNFLRLMKERRDIIFRGSRK